MQIQHIRSFLAGVSFVSLMVTGLSADGAYLPPNPTDPPVAGAYVPPPWRVPGKEYTDRVDIDDTSAADPHQLLFFNGSGAVLDSFDYGDALNTPPGDEVDALASDIDELFTEALNNTSHLLVSVSGSANVYYEHVTGAVGLWATPAHINEAGVADIDALEVWGAEPNNPGDALNFSLLGDPSEPLLLATNGNDNGNGYVLHGRRVSVWHLNRFDDLTVPLIYADDIAAAIGRPDLADLVDVDAMMLYAPNVGIGEFETLVFSISPIDQYDGGEIWVWDGVNPATFLDHGGHQWNTAFDVAGTFDLSSEDVDALETVSTDVPEPAAWLLLIGGWVAACRRTTPPSWRRCDI
jgi:hypothetical protein